MALDWNLAIHRNREALQRIVAALFALVGLVKGSVLDVLPHRVYRAVLAVLRPAESAVRRLIIIAAFGLKLKPHAARSFPANFMSGKGQPRAPVFRLIEPLKRFSPCVTLVEDGELNEIWIDDEDQDFEVIENYQNALPRISLPGFSDPVFATPVEPLDHAFINAAHIGRRLAALKRALENLPREAKRLARWQAKSRHAFAQNSTTKPMRHSAYRPGRPPGLRIRATHEVEHILRECHGLMHDRLAAPDTS